MNTYYVHYNEAGEIKGFYNKDIHKDIPEPNLELDEDEWLDLATNQNQRKINSDTQEIVKFSLAQMPPRTTIKSPNWQSLTSALRGTALFGKVYAAAKTDLNINVPFTLLTATLNSGNPNFNDLQFALFDLKGSMGDRLLEDDIVGLNQVLAENNFEIVLQ